MANPSNSPGEGEPTPIEGATRHLLIVSSTFPAFFVLAIFFAARWVLIAGARADSFRNTALLFTAAGLVLGAINVAIRRRLENNAP